tara:strand:- start:13 stop:138 length:126 start_codon:yes stop_codon:yes gene_type:complete
MNKVFLLLFLLSGCGKKGELFLESLDGKEPIQINEERIFRF